MNKIGKNRGIICGLLLGLSLIFTGCSKQQEKEPQREEVVKILPGAYDSVDTALVVGSDKEKQTLTFLNLKLNKNYTLHYDGTTFFYDKYDTPMAADQLARGEVVDLQFLKGEKRLISARISPSIWTMNEVRDFELNLKSGKMRIQKEYYNLNEETVILSGNEQAEYLDIHPQDTLLVRGKNHDIYSISIEKGHGYLRLENAEYFIGGWIEVGSGLIRKIEQDMLLAVPEGTHKVYVSNTGIEGEKEVTIGRGKESTLDLGDLRKDDLVKYGNLIFTLEPKEGKIFIDGKEIDITRTVKAEYGLHQIMATAEGYETLIQYIRVTQEGANLSITLEKEKEKTLSGNTTSPQNQTPTPLPAVSQNTTGSSTTGNQNQQQKPDTNKQNQPSTSGNTTQGSSSSTSGNSTAGNTVSTTGYKVEINAPVGAEVYVDGNYVGIIPTSFKKAKGNYQITLRKNGYESQTYKIEVGEENKDRPFSFSELTPLP